MVKVDNMEEIYNNYMTLEDVKVKLYLDSIAQKYNILYDTLICKIEKYVHKLSIEEQSKYKKRKAELHYIRRVPSKIKTTKTQKAEMPEIDFLAELNIAIHKSQNASNWFEYLLHILNLPEEEGLEFLRKSQISKETYNKHLEQFKTNYPNQVDYINYLERLYKKYEINNNLIVSEYEEIEQDVANSLLIDILSSGCCIEEYSSITGHTISELKQLFKHKKNSIELEELESRKESRENLKKVIFYLIEKIIADELDIFLYYEATKLDLSEFVNIAKTMVNDNSVVRKLGLFRDKYTKIIAMKINKEAELNGTKIIDGRIVDKEDKEFIIDFLERSNIPIGFYNIYLRKYLNGELDINGKVKCL